MLAKPYRLKKATDFTKTYKFGKNFNHNLFYIKALHTNHADSRIAVVVPKKVSKRAVDRNTYRRRIYEIVRENFTHIQPGYMVIITVKQPLATTTYQDLENLIVDGCKKLGVYVS